MGDNQYLPEGLQKRIEKFKQELEKLDFYVLVWGSGKADPANYEKRLQIVEHLAQRLGPKRVFMSEDPCFQSLVNAYGLRGAEVLQAQGVDAIVVLDTSIGPHTEITAYEAILREKGIVFTKDAHKNSDGFAATSYAALKVEAYSDEQFRDCNYIRMQANNFVQAKLFERARSKWDKKRKN
jgi:hypothetical protein